METPHAVMYVEFEDGRVEELVVQATPGETSGHWHFDFDFALPAGVVAFSTSIFGGPATSPGNWYVSEATTA